MRVVNLTKNYFILENALGQFKIPRDQIKYVLKQGQGYKKTPISKIDLTEELVQQLCLKTYNPTRDFLFLEKPNTKIWVNGREVLSSQLEPHDRLSLILDLKPFHFIEKKFSWLPKKIDNQIIWLKPYFSLVHDQINDFTYKSKKKKIIETTSLIELKKICISKKIASYDHEAIQEENLCFG